MSHILSVKPIIDGKVELFVKSIYKRKRWFDIYLRIWYGNDTNDNSCKEESIVDQEEKVCVKRIIYELNYDQTYYLLGEEDIDELLL